MWNSTDGSWAKAPPELGVGSAAEQEGASTCWKRPVWKGPSPPCGHCSSWLLVPRRPVPSLGVLGSSGLWSLPALPHVFLSRPGSHTAEDVFRGVYMYIYIYIYICIYIYLNALWYIFSFFSFLSQLKSIHTHRDTHTHTHTHSLLWILEMEPITQGCSNYFYLTQVRDL